MEVNVIMPMLGGGTRMQGIQNTCKPLMRLKNGELFFIRALKSLVNYKINRLVLVVLEEYSKDFYNIAQKVVDQFGCKRLDVVSHTPTNTPVETFCIGLEQLQDENLPIVSLDCDIYAELPEFKDYKHAGVFYFVDNNPNKSFIKTHCGYVTDIAEKVSISNMAVFGAYMFDDVDFLHRVLKNRRLMNYMSDVVRDIIFDAGLVKARPLEKVYNYGTLKELQQYESETL